jgi:hypothetical protein
MNAGLQAAMVPHPLLPLPSAEEMLAAVNSPDPSKLAALVEALNKRRELLAAVERDAYRNGFELDHWRDADRLLAELIFVLIMLGGNRSAKSEYCAKRTVQAVVRYPGCNVLCLAEDMDTSKETQQALIWKYMPPELRGLNQKRDPSGIYKINYSVANGFTEGKVVLPNRAKLHFKSYNQEPGECEGWEFGARDVLTIGGWADESLRLNWLKMMIRRFKFRPAQLLWSFTPINGMTPTIKEAVGDSAVTLESRFAELLPSRVNLPGLPVGHMPYIQRPVLERSRVIYFFSEFNKFGVMARQADGTDAYRPYYEGVKEQVAGKPSDYVKRIAYGYTEDTAGRAFPYFGGWNVKKECDLPAEGTNYHLMDPASARNWFMMWVRVTPGNPADYYIYRDWPDEQTFGEWAVPTEREVNDSNRRGWDGDAGPAQKRVLGYGVEQYKDTILTAEVIGPNEQDPYRQKLWRASEAARQVNEPGTDEEEEREPVREEIFERLVDPRAGEDPKLQAAGTKTIVQLFQEEQRHPTTGRLTGPRMILWPASGVEMDKGHTAINQLLFFDKTQDIVPLMNCPRLFVSERCRQVRWALENFTGLAGETGACKDVIDLVRYMAVSGLRHIQPGGKLKTRGGGGY